MSQEILTSFGNLTLRTYSTEYFKKNNLKETAVMDTLALPFFDDFANSFMFPDSTKWIDKFAFINNDFSIDPISYGVATLDAINQFGAVYPHIPSLSSAIADYFTSIPIDLNVTLADSVYLSFFYQCGGNGNSPETRDSLVLQFKAPDLSWKSIWRVAGGPKMDTFKLVMIPVNDQQWLVKGFQFRFINYASLSSNYEPSFISNTDHWNIDYVKLDSARTYTDTLMKDVAILNNCHSLLENFESVPWNHYKKMTGEIMKDTIKYLYKSLYGPGDTININRQYSIVDLYGSNSGFLWDDDSENILPLETLEFARELTYTFDSDSEDSAKFAVTTFIKTDLTADRQIYRWNDTVRYSQNFANYYAYDDGTAEAGYGIAGVNTAFSSLAYQFTPLVADTLLGVYIYFNQVLNEGNRKYFFLNVWQDNGGIPGDTLSQKLGVMPEYGDAINGFVFYPLEKPLLIDTTFYIGWTKTTDDMLNCGFDKNRVANSHVFINYEGSWTQSQALGALMIRPVFGYAPIGSNVPQISQSMEFEIYPNPAKDMIRISAPTDNCNLEIYNASGKLVSSTYGISEIDISGLPSGMYFVKLISDSIVYKAQKLLIVK